jgi:hypothetical protein
MGKDKGQTALPGLCKQSHAKQSLAYACPRAEMGLSRVDATIAALAAVAGQR